MTKPRARMKPFAPLLCTVLAACSIGCARTTSPVAGPAVIQPAAEAVTGSVYGGQQPVSGAQIQLWAVGSTGDSSVSKALLSVAVVSGVNGSFTLTGDYTCPTSSTLVYLTATGGNPGLGSGGANKNLALMAALGTCGSLKNSTFVQINEVTTVGAVMALHLYMGSYSAIGSASADAPGLASDFITAAELVNTATGAASGAGIPSGFHIDTALVDTLADILSFCVNSAGGVSGDNSPCGMLFALTGGSSSTDTITATLSIANNPASNVASLYQLLPPAGPFQPTDTAAPANLAVTVEGASPSPSLAVLSGAFTSNGAAFLPRGLQVRGFECTHTVEFVRIDNGDNGGQILVNAQNAFGPTELAAAANVWNANTIRFLVSQPALDPSDTETITDQVTGAVVPLYDPTYLGELSDAITQARNAGFVVILAMQDEADTGTAQHVGLPTQSTVNAWNQLLPRFGSDPGVVVELYNEPSSPDNSGNWNTWAYGGSLNGTPVIGMQALINTLRTAPSPSTNVMFLDGLAAAATLDGVPGLATPITDNSGTVRNQLAYAVHPYPRGISNTDTPAQYTALWDTQFGNLSQTKLVIATEWSAQAGNGPNGNLGLLGAPSYQVAVDLLNYLVTKRVALSASAYDVPGQLIQALDGTYTPSNYDNYANVYNSNSGGNENSGLLVQKLFTSPYPTTTITCPNGIDSSGINGATCGSQ